MKSIYFYLFFLIFLSCNNSEEDKSTNVLSEEAKLFVHLGSDQTGIYFRNTVKETMTENALNFEPMYFGSGVATGDINNDGLPDIYLGGNSSEDKLYLNKGNLKFEDISISSGISKTPGWSSGVTMVDINADGWLDIYVCRSGPSENIDQRTNRLYINNKDNTFTEAAGNYGLQNTQYSVQAAFFDYDLDGDLDMYLLNHPNPGFKAKKLEAHMADMKAGRIQTDVFYENMDGNFVDRSKEANLVYFGYRHGIAVGDINQDGFPDLFISSDFDEPDVLAINQGNKTFKNEIDTRFSHISFNSMGNELVDINNDGLLDLFVLDMAPEDHFRSKAYMKSMNVPKFRGMTENGYHNQYMFNTLQLNNGNNSFSEIAQFSGIAKTDWSWAPLFFDMDLDGDKDLFVTNGIKENFLFRDLQLEINKRERSGLQTTLNDLLDIVPTDISENLFYENTDGVTFKKTSGKWAEPSLVNSNGVATADFDNDGDLDFIVNNMDSEASLYESKASDLETGNSIKLILKGAGHNPNAVGAKIEVRSEAGKQWQELYTTRGYLSSIDLPLVFGLGDNNNADVVITWPNGRQTHKTGLSANKTHTIHFDADEGIVEGNKVEESILYPKSDTGISFLHREDPFDDYTEQILLPHSQSNTGPSITEGDVNNDGMTDLFIGGAAGQPAALYVQDLAGRFKLKQGPWTSDAKFEDTGVVFFDSDNDGDLDLYVASGGAHLPEGHQNYRDRLYKNNGDGTYVESNNEIPNIAISGKAVDVSDIDGDGDLDLFVGGRIIPDKYPYPPRSYFLINDGGKFQMKEIAVNQLVAAALFTDYDGDGDEDLMTVGEWSPIKVFNNQDGLFSEINIATLEKTTGLWFGLAQYDIDKDGDLDYFAGNIGLNTKFKADESHEFHVYTMDFDNNNTYDVVLSSNYNGELVPSRGRECSSQQMPFIKDKFTDYRSFANATLNDIYGDKLNEALHYKADLLSSVFIENLGNGEFNIKNLPWQTQLAPLNDFVFADINNDGNTEIFAVGNLYNVEVETVRYDAFKGSVMHYKDGKFVAMSPAESGFRTQNDARSVAAIQVDNGFFVLVANNNEKVEVFGTR